MLKYLYLQDESYSSIAVKAAKDLTLVTFQGQPEVIHMILR